MTEASLSTPGEISDFPDRRKEKAREYMSVMATIDDFYLKPSPETYQRVIEVAEKLPSILKDYAKSWDEVMNSDPSWQRIIEPDQ